MAAVKCFDGRGSGRRPFLLCWQRLRCIRPGGVSCGGLASDHYGLAARTVRVRPSHQGALAREIVMKRLLTGLCFAMAIAGVRAQEATENVFECSIVGVSG